MTPRSQKIAVILLFIAILSWVAISELFKRSPELKQEALKFVEENIAEPLLPEPLIYARKAANASLTVAGTISSTNVQRTQNGLRSLTENSVLTSMAEYKLKDMFNRQYFAHNAPDGSSGVADLSKKFGYDYIAIGENLALGLFENDSVLVQAWMESPGHRANILNSNFTQIGIAVGKGVFEGQTTWVAVQVFGKPVSACPEISASLKASIDSNSARLDLMETSLNSLRAEMDSLKAKRDNAAYNQKANEYNLLVSEYNALIAETKKMVGEYNRQVRAFNDCLQ